MDKNTVILTGTLVSATERTIGQQGRSLVELKLAVSRPGRKNEGEMRESVPVVVWDGTLGAALLAMAPETPLTVLGRISAREWQAPSGQAKTFVEIVAESVTIDVTRAATLELVDAPASAPARAEPPGSRVESRPVTRPGGPGRGRSDGEVPF